MDCSRHEGHRHHIGGGSLDGEVQHLVYAHPSDFPLFKATMLRDGMRSWYELDEAASNGTEVVYRFIGHGATLQAVRS